MILIDTSAFYALADQDDINNARAKERMRQLTEDKEELITHNYVVLESIALLQRRLGVASAKDLITSVVQFPIVWVTQEVHVQAAEYFISKAGRKLSFVDCTSFVLMKEKGIKRAFAFDEDFQKAGFELYT